MKKIINNQNKPTPFGVNFKGTDFPISELRIVRLYIRTPEQRRSPSISREPHLHYMHESQVEIFVAASVRLHQTHGNPHIKYRTNGTPPDQLWEITVSRLEIDTNSYWWCTRDLLRNGDPQGAQLNHEDLSPVRAWAHPELLEAEKEARAQEERDEYESSAFRASER